MKPDAVQMILKIVGDVATVDPAAILRAEMAIREEFGGKSLRIQHRAPVTLDQIDAGLRQRKPVAVIAAEVGLSRASIYRMLGKNRVKVSRKRTTETRERGK